VAGVQYSIAQSKFNLISTADIVQGFVFTHEPSEQLVMQMLDHFLSWAKEQKAGYVRVHPWLPATIAGKETGYDSLFEKAFSLCGFEVIKSGRHTYWLDLSLSEEALLSKMTRKTRYEVKQGLKSDIRFTLYEKPDTGIIEQFWDLYKLLGQNKGFSMYPEQKFKNEIHVLLETGNAMLFVASYNDTIVNFSIASNSGIASYLHGAINPEFKNLEGCPSPGQVAQWTMITEMKRRGAVTYDMGFCPGPVPDSAHPAYNIWRFKYGFGGDHVQFLPTYGKVLHPLKGRIFKFLRKSG
jgi:lipid II:glycine glycyltransferase (peptidoglycan interpeptide bridge formation enzyme)